VNKIEEIMISNVKGRGDFLLKFGELYANHPNLLIAPNGFGKSTLAVTFQSLKPNKLELKKEDYYKDDDNNKPSLTIKMVGSGSGSGSVVMTADNSMNEISKTISTFVINSPIYAKSTSKRMGKFSTSSAILDVADLVLVENIPPKVEIVYQIKKIKSEYPVLSKLISNLGDLFKNIENLRLINENSKLFNKCVTQVKPTSAINKFIDIVCQNMDSIAITGRLSSQDMEAFSDNDILKETGEVVRKLKSLNIDPRNDLSIYIATIQIISVIKESSGSISDALKYMEYVEFKKSIDSSKFEIMFTKNIGILIIDEIFDYLDGANMLIVQYYLSKFIETSKKKGKILFPMLLTHLDPTLFGNYYFKRPKIHYLKDSTFTKDNEMLRFLRLRSNKDCNPEMKKLIEKYYLHYHPSNSYGENPDITLPDDFSYGNSCKFYTIINAELEKYVNCNGSYDPLKIICAVRVLVEKIAYDKLSIVTDKEEFLMTNTTSKKLNFLVDKGVEGEEVLFLLQPLYNDALHMDENAHGSLNKIKSACLKLDNVMVHKIVKSLIK